MTRETAEARRLSDLIEIARALGAESDLRSSLARVLELLEERHGVLGGSVTVLDVETRELVVQAASGRGWQRARRTRHRLGEGIEGRVAESGRPVVVPQVTREPLFADAAAVLQECHVRELSYVCAPITSAGAVAGTLAALLPYRREREYEAESRFFTIVAALLGLGLRTERLLERERGRLLEENVKLREELRERYDVKNLIGSSRPMRDVYRHIAQVAAGNTTVLVRGESGTGKELVAHAIHYGSPRAQAPLIKVNCGALPEALIESELFGHEAGAFTDARAQKKGRFELAHGGTLFLDEVGELSPSTQVKLLRVLQEREFERLGGVRSIRVDVRLIAATNKDLELAVQAGTFREDLYYRLNVFAICLPALRDRRPDVPLLADHFVEKYAAAHGRDVRRLATTAIDMLFPAHWDPKLRIPRGQVVAAASIVSPKY